MSFFQIPRFSLKITIGTLMAILLVFLGITIYYLTYKNQKKTTLNSTQKVFDYASAQTQEKLYALIAPVETFVELSARLDRLDARGNLHFPDYLPYMFQSLQSTPWMSSVYLGNEDGDFYMLESLLNNEGAHTAVSAPKDAAFFLKHVGAIGEQTPQLTFTFYDRNYEVITIRKDPYDGFDPRVRPWYKKAINTQETIVTEPYIFFSTKQLGITAARTLSGGFGVFGADSTLVSLLAGMEINKLTPSTEIVVFNNEGNVLLTTDATAYPAFDKSKDHKQHPRLRLIDIKNSIMPQLYHEYTEKGDAYPRILRGKKDDWFIHIARLTVPNRPDIYLALASPFAELMVNTRQLQKNTVLIIFGAVILAIMTALYISGKISLSLEGLSLQARDIRDFRLDKPLTVTSRITEVDRLATSMAVMQSAINRFVEIARALSGEKNMGQVLEMILKEATSITEADGGAVGLISDDETNLTYVLIRNKVTGIHLGGMSGKDCNIHATLSNELQTDLQTFESYVVHSAETLMVEDISKDTRFEYYSIGDIQEPGQYKCQSLLAIPLQNRQEEVIGVLYLINARNKKTEEIISFAEHRTSYAQALASNAALALDNNRLLKAQKELFDSFVRLLAGAIDTKSPYTGGHCQRVPILAQMLAKEAHETEDGPLSSFTMSDDERYELYVAAWLHDCGKVTTPEYVVDKATKLETLYNRIHEIRMRFEVLWRDKIIKHHERISETPSKQQELEKELLEYLKKLRDDYAFLANCNIGGEYMEPEEVERLEALGKIRWTRYFDNGIGLSQEEQQRMKRAEKVELPASEQLLADKTEHIVPRYTNYKNPFKSDTRFCMNVPEFAFNLGELHNLSMPRGTLTEEERFTINNHIVQTIRMLNNLPFPKEMKRVPEWAGNHHEKLDGTGYPRCLHAEDLSVQERIMAIADIFEALTAADRPYKKTKPLSACLTIMAHMSNDGHICPDLFNLFLKSGTYLKYAEKHMQKEQIDKVDISNYL